MSSPDLSPAPLSGWTEDDGVMPTDHPLHPLRESLSGAPEAARCAHGDGAIRWNEFNGSVQCHKRGQVFDPRPLNDDRYELPAPAAPATDAAATCYGCGASLFAAGLADEWTDRTGRVFHDAGCAQSYAIGRADAAPAPAAPDAAEALEGEFDCDSCDETTAGRPHDWVAMDGSLLLLCKPCLVSGWADVWDVMRAAEAYAADPYGAESATTLANLRAAIAVHAREEGVTREQARADERRRLNAE